MFSKLTRKKYALQNATFLGIFFRENGVQNGVQQISMGYTKDDRRKAFCNITILKSFSEIIRLLYIKNY